MTSSKLELLSIHQEEEESLKKFSHHTLLLRGLTHNVLREQVVVISSSIFSSVSPYLVSERNWRELFYLFTRELLGSVPFGTYFLGGPVLVRLAALCGTVPSVSV